MVEPLTSATTHMRRENDMVRWVKKNPTVAAAWFSGVLWQIMATLPEDDPWRRISVRARGDHGEVIERLDPPDSMMGAWLDGVAFGIAADGMDVVPRTVSDDTLDVGLVALAENLPRLAAQALGLAPDDFRDVMAVFMASRSFLAPELYGRELFDMGAAALRWAIWRRRIYVGRADRLPLIVAVAWLRRAELVATGQAMSVEECRFEIHMDRAVTGSWGELRALVSDPPLFVPGSA
ncbi:hypothetical protein RN607_14270 [Demequina capsici]|uniref:Uncharacterized protein n=1 Tax=Demequina capsici TaxID=3075620 RepID=A0AA96JAE5_9MICO|nr:hypothetical protein [Demequina sp. PMTSA13]WNM27345.1 hypothetical protein RN607_14270 [Demequina sp. PMTSA13]